MSARVIDGKASAAALLEDVKREVQAFTTLRGFAPGLAVVLIGHDPASQIYVRNKVAQTNMVGMVSREFRLQADVSQQELLAVIHTLNEDASVHGILVQLPLPPHIDETAILRAVDPAKDVDGFHPVNAGMLATGQRGLVPCTPWGCLHLLRESVGPLAGLHALVIGRSNIVGKPMAQLLLAEHCTVTIAHSRTQDLPALCGVADIVIAALGRPGFVRGDWLKPGACVIDVGINRVVLADGKTRLVGDVDFESARRVAGAITPVPGGVGPMTIAVLLRNTLIAAGGLATAR
ncbi:bifunctional methylenetetrahydrofolate dehydrogenase/methenyltetrahydrofolate cyclohydrolase FolD [Ramlibacter tataouinensis]|uniref:bifunctional methylenetetrahydrofolate dehydrogenase/methenyltetrahydrofolate cyclohydrolase FolD n=1 Tax=Ramlibacter tataouinensis TaxID=94132 RepID=UPI0022F37F1A|nr:bifunctional methylenetetrahydrofolate dehydrogenase/methenyltetrahydrofolate cyclohydrolase FolD [Ramlibacter tataouinensis]WBY02944.1 bifunctional methylenetetrahydrofolate dehydrogenase/methenyltetrahydrofolate cyclohydrolase FolD [Ramlibacter tataouinensis]